MKDAFLLQLHANDLDMYLLKSLERLLLREKLSQFNKLFTIELI